MKVAVCAASVCVLGLAGTLGTDARLSERGAGTPAGVERVMPTAKAKPTASQSPQPRSLSRALTHFGVAQAWFSRHAADTDKARILRGRIKHARDVERFFDSHPRLARTEAGRNARWQHRRMGRWAAEALRVVRRHQWLTLPAPRDWVMAVRVAQRPFPGTSHFLLATSDDEGGRGHWKPYSAYGERYYPGYERLDAVGGPLQYRPSTFRGHWRHAWDSLRERGFRVPWRLRPSEWLAAWLSPLAQALAGGWACWAGKTYSHWDASGNGC